MKTIYCVVKTRVYHAGQDAGTFDTWIIDASTSKEDAIISLDNAVANEDHEAYGYDSGDECADIVDDEGNETRYEVIATTIKEG